MRIGWVFAGNNMDIVYEGGGSYGIAETTFCAEAKACLGALTWALAKGFKRIAMYTDCAALITQLNSKADSNIANIWTLQGIKTKGEQF
uniref:RNase H type-1 domain-containing protein n=1 Tax=Chenopodium quinoa TaxID=63459 RepID=A0A803M4I5_CHEQI